MRLNTGLFVLDSNIFIDAHRRYYAFDIAPGFWQKLKSKAELGLVKSINEVYDELQKGSKDKLALWTKDDFHDHFEKCDATDVISAYTKLINWANDNYRPAAVAEFASVADGWLIAFAYANQITLVSNESRIKKKSKVTIPDACNEFGVSYINVFDLLRKLGITLE